MDYTLHTATTYVHIQSRLASVALECKNTVIVFSIAAARIKNVHAAIELWLKATEESNGNRAERTPLNAAKSSYRWLAVPVH